MRRKSLMLIVSCVAMVACVGLGSCKNKTAPGADEPGQGSEVVLADVEATGLASWWQPVSFEVTPRIEEHKLPMKNGDLDNVDDVVDRTSLSDDAVGLLMESGSVVVDNPFAPRGEYFTPVYETLEDREVPIFVTTDSLLHLYHIQFDETLRQIEEREFYPGIWEILSALLDDQLEVWAASSGEVKEAAKRNVAYLSVALTLLAPRDDQVCNPDAGYCDPDAGQFSKDEQAKWAHVSPEMVQEVVDKELGLIDAHAGFATSLIFEYQEDYSQYVPRGHYTRSEKLKNYFRAFMWLGRISMLLKQSQLVSQEAARIQTMQAVLIAARLGSSTGLMEGWERIYSVTAFYVGLSDDLGPYEYLEAMDAVFGEAFTPGELDQETYDAMKVELAQFPSPKIYGGTGNCTLTPPVTVEAAEECLDATKGFRFMGQRFIPDSYMFSELVSPHAGHLEAGDCGAVFTCAMTDDGPWRVFPRGLDVMVLLGSDRAADHLDAMGDSKYSGYAGKLEQLEAQFGQFDEAQWNRNLYWAWLHSLSALVEEAPEGYPMFMRTDAWKDKTLETALASWTELRHDTILYAKQSYTVTTTSAMPMPVQKPVVGYVEPVPEFYARLLALTRMTNRGLDEMKVLDETSRMRLERLEKILERLLDISIRELEDEELTKDDYDFIDDFASAMNGVIADVDDKAKRATIVADVHTDGNTGHVLEEGVGYVRLVLVAYRLPDGRILVGAGPVFSYHEFKHPMSDRLTDEKWRELLATDPPPLPSWSTVHR